MELAPYQKVPRRKPKKVDVKMGSIEPGSKQYDFIFFSFIENNDIG